MYNAYAGSQTGVDQLGDTLKHKIAFWQGNRLCFSDPFESV